MGHKVIEEAVAEPEDPELDAEATEQPVKAPRPFLADAFGTLESAIGASDTICVMLPPEMGGGLHVTMFPPLRRRISPSPSLCRLRHTLRHDDHRITSHRRQYVH